MGQVAHGEGCGLGPVPGVYLGVDVGDMTLDGAFAEDQLSGDLPVGFTSGELYQNLNFTRSEPARVSRAFPNLGRLRS